MLSATEKTHQNDALNALVQAMSIEKIPTSARNGNARNARERKTPFMGTTNASQPQAPIRVITMELWPQESHPSYGDGFYIGVEGGPHVADLVEGESVILRETGDVEITATAHHVMLDGRPVWFGELTSDYRDISSDTNDTPNTSTAQSLNSY